MAAKIVISSLLFLCFFGLGNAEYCTGSNSPDYGCSGQFHDCCSDGVCRITCDSSCSSDYDCGTGEKCCFGGDCIDRFGSCTTLEVFIWGSIVFLAALVSVLAYCCCKSCLHYCWKPSGGRPVIVGRRDRQLVPTSAAVRVNQLAVPPTDYHPPLPYTPPRQKYPPEVTYPVYIFSNRLQSTFALRTPRYYGHAEAKSPTETTKKCMKATPAGR